MIESHLPDVGPFRMRLEERLRACRQEPMWKPGQMSAEMQGFKERKRLFEQLAPEVVTNLVRPRLAELASFFPNAQLANERRSDRVACWLGFCERFPVSAKVEIVVAHDPALENLILRCEASIIPSFQHLEPNDKLSVPLTAPEPGHIARWVEERLFEFLDAYLRIDRGPEDFEDEAVTDPVCGMRIVRANATAPYDYRGHPYFFCSDGCRAAFEKQPDQFIHLRTL